MQTLFDVTPNVKRTRGLPAFRSAVEHSFVPLQVLSDRDETFAATLSAAGADGVVFTEVAASPQRVERTPELIRQGGSGYYKVSFLLAGTGLLIQNGRETLMRPGDLSFHDTSRPYSLVFDEQFRNLVMMFPKDRLDFPEILADTLTAVSLGNQHPLARVIASFIAQASPQLPVLQPTTRTKLTHTTLELMNTMLSAIFDVHAETRDPHQILLRKIYAHINANLGSSQLSPGTIAAAHYISIRHLHSLFAEQNTTVSTVIRQRRLEHAKADLSNPMFATQTVAAIAARWGFVDAAHFSRVFKQNYQLAPSELRTRKIAEQQ